MSFRIYNKKGKLSYKENKLVKDIQDALEKKFGNNPSAQNNFIPASSPEELKELHLKYCTTDVEFEDVPNTEEQHKEFRDSMKETVQQEEIKTDNIMEDDNGFIDPFNDANPIVRDYVTDVNLDKNPDSGDSNKSNFDEPTTFKEAFTMPDASIPTGPSEKKETKDKKDEPLNPSYNEQSSGRKKRTNKKFAKYIVEAVCMLAERGFIWWTTKDITDAKVMEYELNNEIDLTLLLSMPNGQQATIKEWFKSQCYQAEQLAKFQQAEKDDLAEVLAELLDKKGISPSIEQEVAIIALKMFGEKFMIALDMKKGITNIIEQLKELNKNNKSGYSYNEPQQAQAQQNAEVANEEKNTIVEDIEGNFAGITDIQDVAIIE